jgi:cytochrome c553
MKLRCALLAASLVCGTALAADPPPKADAAKGQAIATSVCAACHGPDGNSIGPENPKLAGQIPEYLSKQLMNFKPAAAGRPAERVNAVMLGFASTLSPDDMRNVAAFYAAQTLKPEKAKNRDTAEIGQRIYRGGVPDRGIAACAGCHGARGEGVPSQYPALAGQFAAYIEAQLKAFRDGARANDPNRMMRLTAARLSDAEMRALADYIAGLR